MQKKKNIVLGLLVLIIMIVFLFFGFRPSGMGNVDKDGNGIWDDLDQAIKKYAKTPEQAEAAKFYFLSHQDALLHPELGTKAKYASDEEEKRDEIFVSFDCLSKVEENSPEFDTKSLKDALLSTRARFRAWLRYNQNLSGGFYSLWDERKDGDPCEAIRRLMNDK